MIAPAKLKSMRGGFRRRKLILTLGALERDIAGIPDETFCSAAFFAGSADRTDYLKEIVRIICEDPKLPEAARLQLCALLNEEPFDERRLCNTARNHLLAVAGTPSAEWDLIIAPHAAPAEHTAQEATQNRAAAVRPYREGFFVYAEDIRSPFNLGSIFRTAEAFGAEKLFLSPFCTDPAHPRAVRSAMGCIDFLPSERIALDELCASMPGIPVFALETGGTPLSRFQFPRRGIVVIGSEELGINPDTLKKMSHGIVSIPVSGVKASLNVGVAFGILMQAWTAAIFG